MKLSNENKWLSFRYFMMPDGAEGGDSTGADGGDPAGDLDPNKTFTQQDVDRIIGDRLSKKTKEIELLRKQQESQLERLKTLEQSKNLTQQEKDELSHQINELETTLMSEKERAAKKQQQLQEKHQSELKKLLEERDSWRSHYEQSTIERNILDAANANEAESVNQMLLMLRPLTRLEPVMNENGEPTGQFQSVTSIIGLNEEGKEAQLELTTSEAIAKLKEDGLNKNLFRHSQSGGTGGRNGEPVHKGPSPPARESFSSQEDFQKAYAEWRKEGMRNG